MRLTIADQHFFAWLRSGQVMFFKDTLVLLPLATEYQQVLQLVEQDYQTLHAEFTGGTFTYSIAPDVDLAQAQIELSVVSADTEQTISKVYHVFLDSVH
ncbi:hypothetical protein [Loigolactobacillus binensis]|uniref:Uncharacterized protein n=1 Tax=Loigolactobacillus binensis TaxID=2559922 RepID=A0ABW3EAU5_9LACO|nr:hypothetical protein [Loigolactobacillus binensis]